MRAAKALLLGALFILASLAVSAQSPEQGSPTISDAVVPFGGLGSLTEVAGTAPESVLSGVAGDHPEGPSPFPSTDLSGTRVRPAVAASGIDPVVIANNPARAPKGVAWGGVIKGSLTFLAVEHGFRLYTEQSTRQFMVSRPFFDGYAEAVGNMHGWSDGDEFYVNWVGHPMQGAVAGYIWQSNDRAYKDVEFGRNRRYWKAKLRGAAFSFVYSTQFEIGAISEATIGFIQAEPPQVGFVDQVVTPAVGLGWTIAEDYVDRSVIQRFETRVANPWLRILLRGGLNPSRSFANAMNGKVPWHRDDRPGVFKKGEMLSYRPAVATSAARPQSPEIKGVAPFELHIDSSFRQYLGENGAGTCIGGSGSALFRVNPEWQIVGEVGGCKMLGFAENYSADTFEYMIGPRWTPQGSSKWRPHFEALIGGMKVTEEYVNRQKEAELTNAAAAAGVAPPNYNAWTVWSDSNGWTMRAGGGLTYRVNSVFAFQLVDFNYQHGWTSNVAGLNYRNNVQLKGGFVLRMGTW